MRLRFVPGFVLALLACGPAAAHPHVFVDSKSEFVVDKNDNLTAIKHHWRFDPAFSAYALQGLDTNGDGNYSREELHPLAQENVESLSEFDYFTFTDTGDEPIQFEDPVDYWLDFDGTQLVLNFTLPLTKKLPLKGKTEAFQIYDPTIFVAFFLDEKQPATVSDASCHIKHIK
ncbi:MAG: DUF1007 family protein, partial [Rhodobiaceae bacterium]|nr:DUF1007 family protein [Rhodobiaceae bacterium]